jgi:Gpi18-like mannosyltransferase
VWLSISGLPESIFFFFIISGIYYFLKWKISDNRSIYLIISSVLFALSNLFRYEGWLFSIVLLLLVLFDAFRNEKSIRQNILFLFQQ